jgi:hypothetical protein
VDDPDAPDPRAPRMTWVHWVLYNIPAQTHALPAGGAKQGLPEGARHGLNDWKRASYGGPCPPTGRHRYFHKLYALDTVLPDLGQPTVALLRVMGARARRTELVGTSEAAELRPAPRRCHGVNQISYPISPPRRHGTVRAPRTLSPAGGRRPRVRAYRRFQQGRGGRAGLRGSRRAGLHMALSTPASCRRHDRSLTSPAGFRPHAGGGREACVPCGRSAPCSPRRRRHRQHRVGGRGHRQSTWRPMPRSTASPGSPRRRRSVCARRSRVNAIAPGPVARR